MTMMYCITSAKISIRLLVFADIVFRTDDLYGN